MKRSEEFLDLVFSGKTDIDMKCEEVEVDGIRYKWSVYRQPTWVTTGGVGLLGLALLIEPQEPHQRELILEFEIRLGLGHRKSMSHHQRFKVPKVRLIQCIRSAIESGYEPSSRGKPIRFNAGSTQPS
jgi:hypothetical protein